MSQENNKLRELANIHCDLYDKDYPKYQSIFIGQSIVCDGYPTDGRTKYNRTTSVISHFHNDHCKNLSRMMTNSNHVLMTEITKNALIGMGLITERATLNMLGPGRTFITNKKEKIELIDANHVPGSSQILVTMTETGEKILYSGDFCYPEISVPKADVLILAAEHGEPLFDFNTDRESVYKKIFLQVHEQLLHDKPVEIRAHPGIMQQIMACLEKKYDELEINKDIKFFADDKWIKLTNSLQSYYQNSIREINLADADILNELYEKNEPYVRFGVPSQMTPQQDRAITITADTNKGFKNNGSFFKTNDNHFFACTASHSSYSDILKYVKEVNPKLVIIDGTRASKNTANNLASTISKNENILAYASPCLDE